MELKPFKESPASKSFSISIDAQRGADELVLTYELRGPLKEVVIPEASSKARKKDFLWEHTCFECFVSEPDLESYCEWNFSPSGDWGYFEFDSYRKPRIQIFGFDECSISWLKLSSDLCRLEARLQLGDSKALSLGMSAVLEHRSGEKSYWALSHSAAKPDFHLRQSFLINI